MFCPNCGSQEQQPNQFCRACGTDLRTVRLALEKPDQITASAASARDDIGRAIAARIGEMNSARDLTKVAEDVLPQIEKFLESPEQRRLRRFRGGVIVSGAGLGVAIMFIVMGLADRDAMSLAGIGAIVFFVGLALIMNGLLFTIPGKSVADKSLEAEKQRELDQVALGSANIEQLPAATEQPIPIFTSVVEHTTGQLRDE